MVRTSPSVCPVAALSLIVACSAEPGVTTENTAPTIKKIGGYGGALQIQTPGIADSAAV